MPARAARAACSCMRARARMQEHAATCAAGQLRCCRAVAPSAADVHVRPVPEYPVPSPLQSPRGLDVQLLVP
jgi:hypothetical protein